MVPIPPLAERAPFLIDSSLRLWGMEEKNRRNILILDPERDTAELFARALETHAARCKCYWVQSAQSARGLLAEIPFNIVLADVGLLQEDRFMLLDTIRKMESGTRVIVNAYLNEKNKLKSAVEMGASGSFIKPIMVNALRKIIDELPLEDRFVQS